VEETGEQVAAREAKSAREEQLKAEVKSLQAAFYCSACRKQYKTVSEMENHLSSYDHHHTKRLRELQQQKRRGGSEAEQSSKRRKEQHQQELMLQRRIAAQAEAAQAAAAVVKEPEAGTCESDDQNKSAAAMKVGFSFRGGVRAGSKKPKPGKKALVGHKVPSAFANPFLQPKSGDEDRSAH
jgi:hypothetical protein